MKKDKNFKGYLKKKHNDFMKMNNWNFAFKAFLIGIFATIVSSIADNVLGITIQDVFDIDTFLNPETNNFNDAIVIFLGFFISAVIVAPILETAIHLFIIAPYYKLANIFPKLKNEKVKAFIYVLPAVIFGLMHYPGYESVSKVISTTIMGLIFSYAYYRSLKISEIKGNVSHLKASIGIWRIHFINNLFAFSLLGLVLISVYTQA